MNQNKKQQNRQISKTQVPPSPLDLHELLMLRPFDEWGFTNMREKLSSRPSNQFNSCQYEMWAIRFRALLNTVITAYHQQVNDRTNRSDKLSIVSSTPSPSLYKFQLTPTYPIPPNNKFGSAGPTPLLSLIHLHPPL